MRDWEWEEIEWKEDDKFYSIVDEMNESDCLKWVQQTFYLICVDLQWNGYEESNFNAAECKVLVQMHLNFVHSVNLTRFNDFWNNPVTTKI